MRAFDYKHEGVTYTVEFDQDRDGRLSEMAVFVSDSPDITAVLRDDFLKDLEQKCIERILSEEREVEHD